MVGPQPYRSPVRWSILQALVDADAPLDCTELARRTGIARSYIRDVLTRPRRARWIEPQTVPSSRPPGRKYVYTITDRGRAALAAHMQDSDKEG